MAAAGVPPPCIPGGASALRLRGRYLEPRPGVGGAGASRLANRRANPRLPRQPARRWHVAVFVYVLLPQGGETPRSWGEAPGARPGLGRCGERPGPLAPAI